MQREARADWPRVLHYAMLAAVAAVLPTTRQREMSKGLDKKKEQKKKPAKTMKEKRTEKSEKKATKSFGPA